MGMVTVLSTATCLPPDILGTITLSRKQNIKMRRKALDKVQSDTLLEQLREHMVYDALNGFGHNETRGSALDACALTTGLCACVE